MSQQIFQGTGSLFENVSQDKVKNQEEKIESKWSDRNVLISEGAGDYEGYKDTIEELSLNKSRKDREKMFVEMRLKQNIHVEVGSSLKDKMTVAKDIYEDLNKIIFKVKFLF